MDDLECWGMCVCVTVYVLNEDGLSVNEIYIESGQIGTEAAWESNLQKMDNQKNDSTQFAYETTEIDGLYHRSVFPFFSSFPRFRLHLRMLYQSEIIYGMTSFFVSTNLRRLFNSRLNDLDFHQIFLFFFIIILRKLMILSKIFCNPFYRTCFKNHRCLCFFFVLFFCLQLLSYHRYFPKLRITTKLFNTLLALFQLKCKLHNNTKKTVQIKCCVSHSRVKMLSTTEILLTLSNPSTVCTGLLFCHQN